MAGFASHARMCGWTLKMGVASKETLMKTNMIAAVMAMAIDVAVLAAAPVSGPALDPRVEYLHGFCALLAQ